MPFNIVLPLFILTAIYGFILGGLVLLLRKLGVPASKAILLGFVLFGVASGLLAAWIWPLDSSVYPNVFATLLGDLAYNLSTGYLGDLWLLRVPQVYVVASTILCTAAGLLFQTLYNRRTRPSEDV
jgi:hypothetical protein